jgi:lipoprotein-anchoring transpeptidase ErfK/SrfK
MRYLKAWRFFHDKSFFFGLLGFVLITGNLAFKADIVMSQDISTKISQELIALKESDERWIEIDLSSQRLTAWEGNQPIKTVIVSTGKKSTPTIPGVFKIQSKRELDRMRGVGYDVPNVPYTMYYHGGYAIHGAYWHNKFGTPVSHGCTNVAVDHAEWLFNWSSIGTSVVIHE